MDSTSTSACKGQSYNDAIEIEENTSCSDDSDQKPAASSESTSPSRIDQPPTKKARVFLKSKHLSSHCLYHPLTSSPVKLYATKQDEELRKQHSSSPDHWSYSHCWTLREMLGIDGDLNEPIDWMIVSTYVADFDFFLQEIPELLSVPNMVVFYQHSDNTSLSEDRWKHLASGSVEFVQRNPSAPKQSATNPLRVKMDWGCHHTKLFLVGFGSGRLRVVVHTSNLRWNDVHLKTQGAFLQDFPLKTATTSTASASTSASASAPTAASSSSSSEFENTLAYYLESYQYNKSRAWRQGSKTSCSLVDQVRKYDFSTAVAILIPSTPGYHKPRQKEVLGYLKVRQAIQKTIEPPAPSSSAASANTSSFQTSTNKLDPLVCQFSSIGSLSQKYLQALWTAWDVASAHRLGPSNKKKDGDKKKKKNPTTSTHCNLELVYPTVQEILHSVEGVLGGGSVPGRENNVLKPFLLPLYRKWASASSKEEDGDPLQKNTHVPHIKTYYQVDTDNESMKWFVLASQNLSKAAWGEVQNGQWGEAYKILHWELGVFISPKTLGANRIVPFIPGGQQVVQEGDIAIPLPYKLRPDPHAKNDKPWTVDAFS